MTRYRIICAILNTYKISSHFKIQSNWDIENLFLFERNGIGGGEIAIWNNTIPKSLQWWVWKFDICYYSNYCRMKFWKCVSRAHRLILYTIWFNYSSKMAIRMRYLVYILVIMFAATCQFEYCPWCNYPCSRLTMIDGKPIRHKRLFESNVIWISLHNHRTI